MNKQEKGKNHPFERTIGPGPYRLVGFFTIIKPSEACPTGNYHMLPQDVDGGSCAHCGMGIMNNYVITRGDGKKFSVGCDCIAKSELPYEIKTKAEQMRLAHEAKKRADRKEAKHQAAKAEGKALVEKHSELLASHPHPSEWRKDSTFLDYANWCLDNSRSCVHILGSIKQKIKDAND